MMFLRSFTVVALLASGGALANPAAGSSTVGGGRLEPRGGSSMAFNPAIEMVTNTLEMVLSNGQRLARGMPPKKPHFRRAADRTGNRPRPSSTPATANTEAAGSCMPRRGVVHVTSPESEGRPHLDGFLSMRANRFGEYGYTAERNNALVVTINDCNGTPFDIVSSNGLRDFPFVGGIKGYSSDSPDLRSGSFNYVYIGGTKQTAPHASPQTVGNAFTTATGIQEPSESAIWSFAQGSTTVLEAHWVNSDGSTPSSTLIYIPSEQIFALAGDVGVVERAADERVARATFTFET